MCTYYQGKLYGLARILYSSGIAKHYNTFEGIGLFTDG